MMKPEEKTIGFEPEGESERALGFQLSYYPNSIVLPISLELGFWWFEFRIINYSILFGWIEWGDDEEE